MKTLSPLAAALLSAAMLFPGVTEAQVLLRGEAASPGSPAHLSITHLADVASQRGIATIQVLEGQVLTNSVQNLAEGKIDITPAPLSLPFLLSKGLGPYSALGEEKGRELSETLRALYPYNVGAVHLIAHDSTGIRSWDDTAGKTVFLGPPRGAALVTARTVMQLVAGFEDGKQYRGLQLNWGQLPTALVDGSADAFVFSTTFPSENIVTALSAGRVNIVSIPRDIYEGEGFQRYLRAPGNSPLEIDGADLGYGSDLGVTLISEDGKFRGVGITFADVVRADLDFDLAKALTAAHIATLDDLRAKAPYAARAGYGLLDPENSGFCGAVPLKYHPGAVAAWEEAGYAVPDCARP